MEAICKFIYLASTGLLKLCKMKEFRTLVWAFLAMVQVMRYNHKYA